MKRTSLLISAALLSLIVGVQTAMAQKVTLYMRGNQTFECDIAQLDSIVFSEAQTIPAEIPTAGISSQDLTKRHF